MLHQQLWEANLDLARACLAHPFVRGLEGGSLAAGSFRAYLAQDAFFLRAFGQAYALAMARTGEMQVFHGLIGGVIEELRLHRGYAAELGIDLKQVRPNAACRAYTDCLLHTAWHGAPAETLAAMTPCMRLYAWLGSQIEPACSPPNRYHKWAAAYASPEFHSLAAQLEELLDRMASDVAAVRDLYRYAMHCELEFFSEALRGAPGL